MDTKEFKPSPWSSPLPVIVILAAVFAFLSWPDEREEILVVGGGNLAQLKQLAAPEGFKFRYRVQEQEHWSQTAERIERALKGRPRMVLFSLPSRGLDKTGEGAKAGQALAELARKAHNAVALHFVGSFPKAEGASKTAQEEVAEANRWFYERICQRGTRRICIKLEDSLQPEQVSAAVANGILRLENHRLSTQSQGQKRLYPLP